MTGMPTDALDLHDAATDDSESPATAFNGVGLGAGLNQIIADAEGTGTKVGPGSSAPARGKALIGSGVASGSGKQQSIWDTLARKNMLVNGAGRTKQRGTLPTTDNSYAIDRSRVLMENANGFVVTQETTTLPTAPGALRGKRYTVGSGNNGKGGDWMPVIAADMDEVAGGVVSLQCKLYISNVRLANMRMAITQFVGTADAISGDPVSSWGADGTNPTLAANWSFVNTPASLAMTATTWTAKYVENQTISSSAKNLAVLIWNDARTTTAADFFIVTDIQLERGAVCTAVERLDEALEEYECMRWFERIASPGAGHQIGPAQATSSNAITLVVPYKVRKRTAPATSPSANADVSVLNADTSNAGTGTISVGHSGPDRADMTISSIGTVTLVAGNTATVRWVNGTGYFDVSAEP